jgi:hypothetical protein
MNECKSKIHKKKEKKKNTHTEVNKITTAHTGTHTTTKRMNRNEPLTFKNTSNRQSSAFLLGPAGVHGFDDQRHVTKEDRVEEGTLGLFAESAHAGHTHK